MVDLHWLGCLGNGPIKLMDYLALLTDNQSCNHHTNLHISRLNSLTPYNDLCELWPYCPCALSSPVPKSISPHFTVIKTSVCVQSQENFRKPSHLPAAHPPPLPPKHLHGNSICMVTAACFWHTWVCTCNTDKQMQNRSWKCWCLSVE